MKPKKKKPSHVSATRMKLNAANAKLEEMYAYKQILREEGLKPNGDDKKLESELVIKVLRLKKKLDAIEGKTPAPGAASPRGAKGPGQSKGGRGSTNSSGRGPTRGATQGPARTNRGKPAGGNRNASSNDGRFNRSENYRDDSERPQRSENRDVKRGGKKNSRPGPKSTSWREKPAERDGFRPAKRKTAGRKRPK